LTNDGLTKFVEGNNIDALNEIFVGQDLFLDVVHADEIVDDHGVDLQFLDSVSYIYKFGNLPFETCYFVSKAMIRELPRETTK